MMSDDNPVFIHNCQNYNLHQKKESTYMIKFSDFVRRQTAGSPHSYTTLSDQEVIARVLQNWDHAKPSYRAYDKASGKDENGLLFGGVVLVSVAPEGFFSGVVQLQEDDILVGVYKARRKGETPRKQITANVGSRKLPAKHVDIVLYHRDVLAEDEPNKEYPVEWEIISINASPTEQETPIDPATLMYNHFHADGGTKTGLTDVEFVEKLRVGFEYWADKSMAG